MIYRRGNCVTSSSAKARNLRRRILHVVQRGILTEPIPRQGTILTYNNEMLPLINGGKRVMKRTAEKHITHEAQFRGGTTLRAVTNRLIMTG